MGGWEEEEDLPLVEMPGVSFFHKRERRRLHCCFPLFLLLLLSSSSSSFSSFLLPPTPQSSTCLEKPQLSLRLLGLLLQEEEELSGYGWVGGWVGG